MRPLAWRRETRDLWNMATGATTTTGRLSNFQTGVRGYFRSGEESIFPWHRSDSSVWYSLLIVESGRICRYGFTSAETGKRALVAALESLAPTDEVLLLGIWNGSHRTDLFVLEPSEALAHPQRSEAFRKVQRASGYRRSRTRTSRPLQVSCVQLRHIGGLSRSYVD